MLSWVEQEARLTGAALTIRAQALDIRQVPEIFYTDFYVDKSVPSTRVSDLTTTSFRPMAARRNWDARGRQINKRMGDLRTIEMSPIESWFNVTELEIQRLMEDVGGSQAAFREALGLSIPARTDELVQANLRRVQYEAMRSWANGTFDIKNPENSDSITFDFGFDTARYPTDGTPWTTSNAYARMLVQAEAALSYMAGFRGAVMTYNIYSAILASAPHVSGFPTLTRPQLEERISGDLGAPFVFQVARQSVYDYTDGGVNGAYVDYWPAGKFAFIPTQPVGVIAKAPIARAYELVSVSPEAKISVREMNVYRELMNAGRELTVECQANWMPIPNENSLFVVATGIA